MNQNTKIKIIINNKRASYDFFLSEKTEAGLELVGTEVKSLRNGKAKLAESYIAIDSDEEAWLYNMHIPHYDKGNINNHNENRKRKLLLHKKEILKLQMEMKLKALTLIPTKLYFSRGRVKIEIALAKGKKLYDKRHELAKKDALKKVNIHSSDD